MTTPAHDDVLAWARGILSTDANAPPEQVRLAAMRLARTSEFAPAIDDAVAIGIALGRPRDPVKAFASEVYFSRDEDNFGRAVDEFARAYFDLPCEERASRWRELHARTAVFPWWGARLDHLRRALDVVRPPYPDGLVKTTLDLFVLPATERAARRRDAVGSMGSSHIADEMHEMKATHPAIASLAAEVFGEKTARSKPRRTVQTQPATVTRARYEPPAQYSPQPQQQQNGWLSWPVWIVIALVLSIGRLATLGTTRHDPPPFRPAFQQPFNAPKQQPIDDAQKQIEEILRRRRNGEDVPIGKGMKILLGEGDNPKK